MIKSELTRTGLIYYYYIGGQVSRSHSFDDILRKTYEHSGEFKLFLEYGEYSE